MTTSYQNSMTLDLSQMPGHFIDHRDSFYGAKSNPTTDREDEDFTLEDLDKLMITPTISAKLSECNSCTFDMAVDDEEYGFYDECEATRNQSFNKLMEENSSNESFTPSSSVSSSLKMASSPFLQAIGFSTVFSSSTSLASSSSTLANDVNVMCVIENFKAPISCRSFERQDSQSSNISVCVSISGLRVVHDGCREEAEYKFCLSVDGQEYVRWKRYEDFRSLGEACLVYAQEKTRATNKPFMQNTVKAWQKVLKNRPWWSAPQTNLNYLLTECHLLEVFVKNLLFEIPCVQMLIEFSG